uniref:clathrin heavy chain linker domain-containing protein 1-like isoform X1 n=1 Tax=Styela clava TaxID=7725 RepID=UPI0019393239|nr:clathrin heavy chain linker domain-containing protein 1-like isoform X1 [Styela clava]
MDAGERLLYTDRSLHGNKPPLPPIVCERDKIALKEVQNYIKTELQKVGCTTPGPDDRRYWIYSTAFSKLISKVTVYKDILSDIKREYEDCIAALKTGQREAKFLQVKIKTLSSLPTTVNGYQRRQKELENRLSILNSDNQRLENTLNELLKIGEEDNSSTDDVDNVNVEDSVAMTTKTEKFEKRPIPGLPVIDWTNEKTLKSAVENLDSVIEELRKQKKTLYVPKEKRDEMLQEFKEKMKEKEQLAIDCAKLKKRHKLLKMANEAAREYKELALHRKGGSLSDYILKKVTNYSMKRESSLLIDSPHAGFEDDDPSREKEAEMILEYIEKFNELFYDGEYANAATHAAISPRGVLRAMGTFLRFKEVSINYVGTPTPLFMFAEAFMYSSSAHNHFADEEMSYECVNCALNENRPDMVLHWVTQGCIKSCKAVADRLCEYAESCTQNKDSCLAAAQKMYSETSGCKILAASLLYKIGQVAGMLDYTHVEKFTRETYFELIKQCMDENLVWILSRTTPDEYSASDDSASGESERYISYQSPLPIPLSHSLIHLIQVGDNGKILSVQLLDKIYNGQKVEKVGDSDDSPLTASDLSKVIYEDGQDAYDNNDLVKRRWKAIAKECENQDKFELAMDIHAAIVVRNTISKALSVIAEDEKEQFDYYT